MYIRVQCTYITFIMQSQVVTTCMYVLYMYIVYILQIAVKCRL